jgi:hypothetical protein
MTVDDAMQFVESSQFGFATDLAGGYSHFQRIIGSSKEVSRLTRLAHESPHVRGRILRRILELAELMTDPRHENPRDAVIATYLSILHRAAPEFAQLAAENVARARGYWWARRAADDILFTAAGESDSGNSSIQAVGTEDFSFEQAEPSRDDVLLGSLLSASPHLERLAVWPEPDCVAA